MTNTSSRRATSPRKRQTSQKSASKEESTTRKTSSEKFSDRELLAQFAKAFQPVMDQVYCLHQVYGIPENSLTDLVRLVVTSTQTLPIKTELKFSNFTVLVKSRSSQTSVSLRPEWIYPGSETLLTPPQHSPFVEISKKLDAVHDLILKNHTLMCTTMLETSTSTDSSPTISPLQSTATSLGQKVRPWSRLVRSVLAYIRRR